METNPVDRPTAGGGLAPNRDHRVTVVRDREREPAEREVGGDAVLEPLPEGLIVGRRQLAERAETWGLLAGTP